LNRTIQITCPRCHGQGKIRTVQSLTTSIIHILQEQATKSTHVHFEIQVPTEVATFLANEQRNLISHIEKLHEVKITIVPNAQLQTPNHYIKQVKIDSYKRSQDLPSHHLIERPKPVSTVHPRSKQASRSEPVVKQFLSDDFKRKPRRSPPKKQSALRKFLAAVFGSGSESKKEEEKAKPRRRYNPHNRRRTNQNRNYRRRPQHSRSGGNRSQSSGSGERSHASGDNDRSRSSNSGDRSHSSNRRRPSSNRRYNNSNRNNTRTRDHG